MKCMFNRRNGIFPATLKVREKCSVRITLVYTEVEESCKVHVTFNSLVPHLNMRGTVGVNVIFKCFHITIFAGEKQNSEFNICSSEHHAL